MQENQLIHLSANQSGNPLYEDYFLSVAHTYIFHLVLILA